VLLASLAHRGSGCRDTLEDAAPMGDELVARDRHLDPVAPPMDELDAKLALELAQRARDLWL
jgi:hypothetical protein